MIQDQVDPLGGMDKKIRSSMKSHATFVMGLHTTMWSLIYTMGAAIAHTNEVFLQKKHEVMTATGLGMSGAELEVFAQWVAYQYTVPTQNIYCAFFAGASMGAQAGVWASCAHRASQSDRWVTQYQQAAGATEFTQAGSANAVVDPADGWATRVGSFGWGGGQESSSSFAPVSPTQRGPVSSPSPSPPDYSSDNTHGENQPPRTITPKTLITERSETLQHKITAQNSSQVRNISADFPH